MGLWLFGPPRAPWRTIIPNCVINQQHLPSNVRSLVSVWTTWRLFTSSQLFLDKNSAGCSTPRKTIHNQQFAKKKHKF